MGKEPNNIIDSSKLADFKLCPRKYLYRHILGWTPEHKGFDLIVGSAWHEAMAAILQAKKEGNTYESALPLALALFNKEYDKIECPPETGAKTRENCLNAIISYVTLYDDKDDFRVLEIEIPGAIPLTEDGDKILHFKLDTIIEKDGVLAVLEHKTASRTSTAWEQGWNIKTQIGAYLHFLSLYDDSPRRKCVYINAAILAPPPRIKKNGEPYANSGAGTQFLRLPVSRTDELMQSWLNDTLGLIYMIDLCKERNWFPRNDTGCTTYRGCPYIDMCVCTGDPLDEPEPPLGYVKEYWDPREEH